MSELAERTVTEHPMPECPRLRSDIIVTRHEGATGGPFVAKDPETRRFFRFREAEHFIISQLDGETSLDEVRRRAEAQFGAELPEASLVAFVRRLQEFGLLESSGAGTRPRRGRLQGSIFLLRFKVFDPDRILTKLAKPLGPLFSVPFFLATLALIGLAVVTTASNTAEMSRDFQRLLAWESLILLWLVVFIVGGIHEFAHGLACKRFGGEVHEIGALLIYLMPGFYCDVSDAWLFPKKWQRLLVTAVGPYMDIVLWAGATVVWRVTNTDTIPHSLALIVMGATGLKLFFNLNPLLKLDGYYLLSDALGIPNLRQRSFAYLGMLILRRPSPALPALMSGRERALYFVYGVLALAVSFGMLWIITMHLGASLLPRFQAWGFVLLVFLVGVRLRYRILALLGKPTLRAAAEKPIAAMRTLPARSAAGARSFVEGRPALRGFTERSAHAIRPAVARMGRDARSLGELIRSIFERAVTALRSFVDRTPALRSRLDRWPMLGAMFDRATTIRRDPTRAPAPPWTRLRKVGVFAVVALLFLIFHIELRLGGEFRVLPTTNADVRSEIEGLVAEVAVHEGKVVKAGDLVARLSDRDIAAELRKTEAAIAEKQAGMRMHEVELLKEQTSTGKAEARLHYRRRNLARMQALRKAEFVATKDLDQAEEDAAVREKELAEARLTTGSRREEILSAAAEIERLQAQAQYLQEQRRLTYIHSRIDGVVTTPERQLRNLVGQNVKKGDLVAAVHRLDTVTAEIALSERDIGEIQKGQYVAVRARAYPNTTFAGKVTSVAAMVRTPGAPVPGGPLARCRQRRRGQPRRGRQRGSRRARDDRDRQRRADAEA